MAFLSLGEKIPIAELIMLIVFRQHRHSLLGYLNVPSSRRNLSFYKKLITSIFSLFSKDPVARLKMV